MPSQRKPFHLCFPKSAPQHFLKRYSVPRQGFQSCSYLSPYWLSLWAVMLLTTQPFCPYWHSRWEKPLTATAFCTNVTASLGKRKERETLPMPLLQMKSFILLCIRDCQSTPSAKGLDTSAILRLFSERYLEDLTNSQKAPRNTDHKEHCHLFTWGNISLIV